MPRIAARQPDGTILVAYGHAGLIVNENDGPLWVVNPYFIGTVWSKIRFGQWTEVNEPVPDGFLAPEVVDAMADFESGWLQQYSGDELDMWLEDRPDTGDPAPRL
ncbi:hypothetical protein ACWFMI_25185 [Nocardiopsis terrae]|uniref:hypothetical protein n=1 Tax=Streptomyces sp. NPDC057554 TaxID=3350538 RepID=UPI0036A03682